MRYGTSVKLSLKQASQTSHYIWRTQSDGCVRESHAKYNGKVFAWDNPPATGHPGEDFNYRCIAEPYTPAIHETLNLVMTGISDSAQVWEDNLRGDFVDRYWNGNGEPVRLRDTGHLRRVVNEYWRQVKTDLLGQIANAARDKA
ncbi:MAG: phage minor head protein, partial [Rhizobiaceae bacterium]